MGDMKTPDFDDLLAAFDIPDATGLGAKEAVQESKGELDSQQKPIGTCFVEGFSPTIFTDVPAVSVIVKKLSQHDSVDTSTAEHESKGPETLSDLAKINSSGFSKPFDYLLNGATPTEPGELMTNVTLQQKPQATLSQPLSELSLCTEFDAAKTKENETHPDKPEEMFTNGLMESLHLVTSKEDVCKKFETDKPKMNDKCVDENIICYKTSFDNAPAETLNSHIDSNKEVTSFEPSKSTNIPSLDSKSQSKLSSCLEALAALNALKDPNDLAAVECTKASPKVVLSPGSPRSPLDTVKRLMKASDSPVSVCSESSGMVSPAVASPPAIPRVRIKTIKTSSGHIRRTVASVLPDSETEEVQSAYESSPCQSMISEDSYNMSPSQNGTSSPKHFLNKTETTIRRLQSSGVSTNKRKTVYTEQKPKKSIETRSSANTNHPKAIHLASLNLVPHSVAASVASRSCNQSSVQTVSSRVSSSVPLVHQVNTGCPSPPNKAVGTLNRLLHYANPVPTYVPNLNPPPESNISLPPHGYRCLECGDSFGVERSLKYHYNRRSVHIEVTCTHCRKTLLFFNRCALLAHAREHKVNGSVMQCTQLYMKPIAEEQMFVPLRSESPVQSGFFKSSSQKNAPVMPLYQEHVAPQRLSCTECDQHCSNLKALAGHYQRVSEDTDRLMCKICSMFLPNKCSFRAHQRIHTHKSPFCCPECGVLCRSADIHNHVKENCLHYARKTWYKCLHCEMVFKSLQGQKTHITEKHFEMFFKCSVCPVAFKSSERCETHLKNKHSTSNSSPQLIYKCSCETIFKKKQLLYQHFHEDAFKRVKCMFKCPKCHSVFALKQQLMQHFKNTHKGRAEKNGKHKHEQHKDHKIQVKKICESSVKPSDDPPRKSDQSRAGTKAKRVKRYPCQHCDQSFNFTTSLRKHIHKDHDGRQESYVCWYCTDTTTFPSSIMLKNHMSLMHGIKNADFDQMPKTLDQEFHKLLRKGRDGSPVLGVKIDDQTGDADARAEKRQKMSFRCAKCGFVTSDGQEFEQHIPQHKLEEGTPQCRHCGLCFTSTLALNRHRYIVHKVRESEEEIPVESQRSK